MTTEDPDFDREQLARCSLPRGPRSRALLGRMHAVFGFAPSASRRLLDMVRLGRRFTEPIRARVCHADAAWSPAVSPARVAYASVEERTAPATARRPGRCLRPRCRWHADGWPRAAAAGARPALAASASGDRLGSRRHDRAAASPVQIGDGDALRLARGFRPEDVAAACGSSIYDPPCTQLLATSRPLIGPAGALGALEEAR
jgi:hypothetical protein